MKVKVYNLIILDESGSMQSIQKPAIDGFNETLQSIQSAQETHKEFQEHFVTLIFFNSNGIRTVIDNMPVNQTKMLEQKEFIPTACTPLYDAMGISLSKLRCQLDEKENTQVLVTIITDGYENSSKEYTGRMIKKLVDELKASDWVFTYIGANQDVNEVAGSMSIDNKLSFTASQDGYRSMEYKVKECRTQFYNKVSQKLFNDEINLQENFFIDDKV